MKHSWPWKSVFQDQSSFLVETRISVFSYVIWWTGYEKNTEKTTEVSLTLKIYSQGHIKFLHKRKLDMPFQRHWCVKLMYENLLKTRLILEMKFDLELAIFKVKGVCENVFTIFFIFNAWNYIEIPSQTFMRNETNFLYCTLRCLRGCSIYRPADNDPRTWELAAPTIHPTSSWLLPRSTAIGWLNKEDTMSSRHLWWGPPALTFWDHCQQSGRGHYLRYPVILCINFAFHKRSICTEIPTHLKG